MLLIVLPRLYTTEGGVSIFHLSGKKFLTLSKWSIELRFMQSNPLLWKNTGILKGAHFFYTLLSASNTLVTKISIINSPIIINSSVAFDANFLRSFFFISSKILRKLSLLFFGGNVATWANEVSVVSNLVVSLTRYFSKFSRLLLNLGNGGKSLPVGCSRLEFLYSKVLLTIYETISFYLF